MLPRAAPQLAFSPLFFAPLRAFSSAATTLNIDAAETPQSATIKINILPTVSEHDLLQQQLERAKAQTMPDCWYPKSQKVTHGHRWSGTKKDMHYSKWKLNAVAAAVRGKSLIDAKTILGHVDKKGAKFVQDLINEIEAQGVRRGRNPEQMFVRTATVGGSIMFKKPDIKGRGRTGVIKKPICSIRIVLEEKTPADFYKLMLQGRTPTGLSALFRRMLYQNKSDFEHIRSTSHMLTSAGRYYRRTQFKRLVQLVQKEYRKKGIVMRPQKIERNLLNRATAAFVQQREEINKRGLLEKQSARTQHFEKNYQKQ